MDFLYFFGWPALSTHLYLCNIKGLCSNRENVQISTGNIKDSIAVDPLNKSLDPDLLVAPGTMLIYICLR
jgi:hypothetical protein